MTYEILEISFVRIVRRHLSWASLNQSGRATTLQCFCNIECSFTWNKFIFKVLSSGERMRKCAWRNNSRFETLYHFKIISDSNFSIYYKRITVRCPYYSEIPIKKSTPAEKSEHFRSVSLDLLRTDSWRFKNQWRFPKKIGTLWIARMTRAPYINLQKLDR